MLEQHLGRTVPVPTSWRGPGRWFGGKTTHMSPDGWDFQADAWLQGPLPAPSRAQCPRSVPTARLRGQQELSPARVAAGSVCARVWQRMRFLACGAGLGGEGKGGFGNLWGG